MKRTLHIILWLVLVLLAVWCVAYVDAWMDRGASV